MKKTKARNPNYSLLPVRYCWSVWLISSVNLQLYKKKGHVYATFIYWI